jgi:hypothetical protein
MGQRIKTSFDLPTDVHKALKVAALRESIKCERTVFVIDVLVDLIRKHLTAQATFH